MSAQYSPTPWLLSPDSLAIYDELGRAVGKTRGTRGPEVHAADGERIVECVNACAEIPDPSRITFAIEQCRNNENPAFAPMAAMFLDMMGVSS